MLFLPCWRRVLMARLRRGGHHSGCVAGAGSGVVFAVGGVADPVESVFDVPVVTHVAGDLRGVGQFGGQAGHAERGVGAVWALCLLLVWWVM